MMKLINLPKFQKEYKDLFAPAGARKKQLFKYVYDEKYGCPRRVPNGFMDMQDFIQESADDIDFKAIGKMLVDTQKNIKDHFSVDGKVFDVTGMPRDIHEYNQIYQKMQSEFDSFDKNIKALFKNDFNVFKACYDNGTLGNVLNSYFSSLTPEGAAEEGDSK